MKTPPKSKREEEAKKALERLEQQSEKILGAETIDRPGEEDHIEVLGKRIARILSIAFAIGLVIYLWRTYLSG